MTLNKNKTIGEVGRRTRLQNHDVQLMFETLIDVWSEELGCIELRHVIGLGLQTIGRAAERILPE